MRKVVDDPRLIYKCCKLYYEEKLGQQEIADTLGVSRVSISRLLQAGRDAGMVKIHIVSPNHLTYTQLERDLEQMYGLKEAVVVENDPLATKYDHLSALGEKAIHLLENYLHDGDMVGVSMGMTLHNIMLGTRPGGDPINCTFVPTIGGVSSGRSATVNIHSNQIAMDFARLFGGQYVEFFSPAVFSNPDVLRGFMKEIPMRNVLEYYSQIKTIITGIGIPARASSTMIRAGYVTHDQMEAMVKEGVAGDLLLQFFDRNGKTERFQEFNSRVAGMTLDQLRTVENRITIGTGEIKAEAIYGAMQGGYVNILVTDEECARSLLKLGKEGRI